MIYLDKYSQLLILVPKSSWYDDFENFLTIGEYNSWSPLMNEYLA